MVWAKGQSGNKNGAATNKEWRNAIRMALSEKQGGEWQIALRKIATTLIEAAQKGDMSAIKEVGDRMDGKPAQAIIGGEEEDPAIKCEVSISDKELIARYIKQIGETNA